MMLVPGVVPPVTMPDPRPTVAVAVVPLSHVPPEGVPVSVVVAPSHTASGPEIATGSGLTDTIIVRTHPVDGA